MNWNSRDIRRRLARQVASGSCMFLSLLLCVGIMPLGNKLHAQILPPDSKELFIEDTKEYKQERENTVSSALERRSAHTNKTAFNAPEMVFQNDGKVVKGRGGVIVNYDDFLIEGNEGEYHVNEKDVVVEGDVVFTSPDVRIKGSRARYNLLSKKGEFEDCTLMFEDRGFVVKSSRLKKLGDEAFSLTDAQVSSCDCPDGCMPWSFNAKRLDITEEGYAKARHVTFNVHNFPIFYSPYFAYPARVERTSGMLRPVPGYSRKDGFQLLLPFFWNVNETTDLILSPFIETRTRVGSSLAFNKNFFNSNWIKSKFYYSNESLRDGALRGTKVDDLFDPSIDENRLGLYMEGRYSALQDLSYPVTFLGDIHFASDDLFIREIEDPDIGYEEDRYLVSKLGFFAPIGDYLNLSLEALYTQSIVSDDDLLFQRLPSATLDGYKTFLPFGYNKYGLKLVTSGSASAVRFERSKGYDGFRYDMSPTIKTPYHYKNYFNGELYTTFRATQYNLISTDFLGGKEFDSNANRFIVEVGGDVETTFERIYNISSNSILKRVTSLGVLSRYSDLLRVKHTVSPFVSYSYVPPVGQDNNPLFDGYDRLKEKSVITYGITSDLIGRFDFKPEQRGTISEFQPTPQQIVRDIYGIDDEEQLTDLFAEDIYENLKTKGRKEKLATFSIKQSYDYLLKNKDGAKELSDIGISIGAFPSKYFGAQFTSNYDYQDNDFSSWSLMYHIMDDRGDLLRNRINFVRNSVSQVDTNLEFVLLPSIKLGYYSRYDDREGEFIENRVALRIKGSCDCWHVDIGFVDQTNPDNQSYTVTLSLKGIGDLG